VDLNRPYRLDYVVGERVIPLYRVGAWRRCRTDGTPEMALSDYAG
jgi:hypothetical protein